MREIISVRSGSCFEIPDELFYLDEDGQEELLKLKYCGEKIKITVLSPVEWLTKTFSKTMSAATGLTQLHKIEKSEENQIAIKRFSEIIKKHLEFFNSYVIIDFPRGPSSIKYSSHLFLLEELEVEN